ncbi:hypothetical protein HK103_002598 [Boothiomyces macroporosus]|uniref:C2H2-type domain-containing protein n=1 Tax=Boothiomyces macroporosus TaxID=261099 RepID=A0AAD5UCR3_9FUNG|nr:hypothetical protein HK103_002598 [Boothiomyces macroporosus]
MDNIDTTRQYRRSSKKSAAQEWPCNFEGCTAVLYSKSSQFRHRRLHEQPHSKYACTQCKEKFLVKLDLIDHTRKVHMPAGSYVLCEQCKRTFSSLSNLNAHMEIHKEAVKPKYSCKACNVSYFHRSALRRHQRTEHTYTPEESESSESPTEMSETSTISNIIGCKICSNSFISDYELHQHLGTHFLSKDYKCIINHCNYQVESLLDFEEHGKFSHNTFNL